MRYWIAGLGLLLTMGQTALSAPSSPSPSSQQQPVVEPSSLPDPMQLMQNMQVAYHNLNYELSYIRVRQGAVEPIRLFHAKIGSEEVVHRIYLNGPSRETVRRGDTVAFYQFGRTPYSIKAKHLPGVFETLSDISLTQLEENYDVLVAGKSRIAGRPAQVIRIVPRHEGLYGLYLWQDQETALPLRVDTVDRHGNLVEQLMVVGILTYDQPTDWMKQLLNITFPPVSQSESPKSSVSWQFDWKPQGMTLVSQDQHQLAITKQSVNYAKLSDGIFDVSVYVNPVTENTTLNGELVRLGATSLHSIERDGLEITVVGEIPPHTASLIAESVRILPDIGHNPEEKSHE
ncbi:MucB/RseB C-terminal domain-containing protein [Celerinatantimonas sp. YJH-8]|uniref:MucB/RseB C-terminal domain-containing protein n=1 Tax=Celerinatantimonas sp. YJH-8 TaxID=3228714 RepID=UPI0038C5DEAD